MSIEYKKKGHFYWSQKDSSFANYLYNNLSNKSSTILDPFMGAGSSLFAIEDTDHKFIGVEINEMPIEITKFYLNYAQDITYDDLLHEINSYENEFKHYYEYKLLSGHSIILERVLFDNNTFDKVLSINIVNSYTLDSISQKELFTSISTRYKSIKITEYPDLDLTPNSRIAIKNGMKMSDIFSPINFLILSELKTKNLSKNFKFLLGTTLHLLKLTDKKSQSQFPYWLPKTEILDRNIFESLRKKLHQIHKHSKVTSIKLVNNQRELDFTPKGVLIINKPMQNISNEIKNSSIDFVITDPPYYDQVAYSEYLKIWEFFLGYKSNTAEEIVVSQRNIHKASKRDYLDNLNKAFGCVYNKMKNDSEMWIYFKDSNIENVLNFLNLLKGIGFHFIGQEYIKSKKFTYKQNTSKNGTITGENILKFTKSAKFSLKRTSSEINSLDIKNLIIRYLGYVGKATLSEILCNAIIKELYLYDSIESKITSKFLVSILNEVASYDKNDRTYSIK